MATKQWLDSRFPGGPVTPNEPAKPCTDLPALPITVNPGSVTVGGFTVTDQRMIDYIRAVVAANPAITKATSKTSSSLMGMKLWQSFAFLCCDNPSGNADGTIYCLGPGEGGGGDGRVTKNSFSRPSILSWLNVTPGTPTNTAQRPAFTNATDGVPVMANVTNCNGLMATQPQALNFFSSGTVTLGVNVTVQENTQWNVGGGGNLSAGYGPVSGGLNAQGSYGYNRTMS